MFKFHVLSSNYYRIWSPSFKVKSGAQIFERNILHRNSLFSLNSQNILQDKSWFRLMAQTKKSIYFRNFAQFLCTNCLTITFSEVNWKSLSFSDIMYIKDDFIKYIFDCILKLSLALLVRVTIDSKLSCLCDHVFLSKLVAKSLSVSIFQAHLFKIHLLSYVIIVGYWAAHSK